MRARFLPKSVRLLDPQTVESSLKYIFVKLHVKSCGQHQLAAFTAKLPGPICQQHVSSAWRARLS